MQAQNWGIDIRVLLGYGKYGIEKLRKGVRKRNG